MATALQSQLSAIAANSIHQLDLKVQKSRHGASLLFDPREASNQSFDAIYTLCLDGFADLCQLDARFIPFKKNLFGEGSRSVDRTQLTESEDHELNQTIEQFLGLVSGRLLLKSAQKAVEWLVRKFRVQEYSTDALLLSFLPYHTSDIFATMLSILPKQLPSNWKWLHPYVATLQSPPRHAVLSAAIRNPAFFTSFSTFVTNIAKERHHCTVLLGFWAALTAQAVYGMLEFSASGRDAVRRQMEEDVLTRVLPVLQSAFSIRDTPEMFLGACMISTILATKSSLEDRVLDAMMNAISTGWTDETREDGIVCLAVLADRKDEISISKFTAGEMLKMDCERLLWILEQLVLDHRIGKLTTATAIAILDLANSNCRSETEHIELVEKILHSNLVEDNHKIQILSKAMQSCQGISRKGADDNFSQYVSNILTSYVSRHERNIALLEQAAHAVKLPLQSFGLASSSTEAKALGTSIASKSDTGSMDVDDQLHALEVDRYDTEQTLKSLPAIPKDITSFLDPVLNVETFRSYVSSFQRAAALQLSTDLFFALPQLHRQEATQRSETLTFLARLWCSNTTTAAKIRAIEIGKAVAESVDSNYGLDLQALLPYVLTALADPVRKVRKAAADLCTTMNELYGEKVDDHRNIDMWGLSIYGVNDGIQWLASDDARTFLRNGILPRVEDCTLDDGYITRSLSSLFDGEKKHFKASLRQSVAKFLASHAQITPVLRVRLKLLSILGNISKLLNDNCVKIISEIVRSWTDMPTDNARKSCIAEGIELRDMDKAVVETLTHRTNEEVIVLRNLASGKLGATRSADLSPLAYARMKRMWTKMKSPLEIETTDWLINLTLGKACDEIVRSGALETLGSVRLSIEVLIHILDDLPNASDVHDKPTSAKKRRMSSDFTSTRPVDYAQLQIAIRRTTLVLELVESNLQHPQQQKQPERLLNSLFHTLSKLHHFKIAMESELVYVYGLVLGCLLDIVDGIKPASSDSKYEIDRSFIRADLVVDTLRSTTSTQIHNTALLLVSSLASWAPELVLHSVMPLFTFMSSTVLRRADDMSGSVVDMTVQRILPPLAASLRKNQNTNVVTGAAELLLSFVAAWEHIPLHRRPGVFKLLIETLGVDEILGPIGAMLTERYSADPRVGDFVMRLTNHFDPTTALRAAEQWLDLIYDGLKPRKKRGSAEKLLGFNDKDEGDVEDAIHLLLEGLAALVGDTNTGLRRRLAALDESDDGFTAVQTLYTGVLEKTMRLTRDLSSNDTLKESADRVLTSVLGLLPTSSFIEASAQLMQTGSEATRQQVFRSLEARVPQNQSGDTSRRNKTDQHRHADEQQIFIDVLPNCCVFVSEKVAVETRHAAVSCIDRICERFGKTNRDAVLQAAEFVAGSAALGANTSVAEDWVSNGYVANLRVISTLCLANIVEILGEGSISILPAVLTKTLGYLEECPNANQEAMNEAVFSLMNAILVSLPWMMADEYLDRALRLATAHANVNTDGKEKSAVATFCQLVAKKANALDLLTAIERVWESVRAKGFTNTSTLLQILHQTVQQNTKATITKHAQTLFNVLLHAFDLRRMLGRSADDDRSVELLRVVDQIAIHTTLKLNDATFRPFFVRLVEWTNDFSKLDQEGRTQRQISFFSFVLTMLERLRSIMTSYASLLIDSINEILRRKAIYGLEASDSQTELLALVLKTLSSSFENDQDAFWQAPAHFNAVASPLIEAVPSTASVSNGIEELLREAITSLAFAVSASPEQLKSLNHYLLTQLRHPYAPVRLAIIKVESSTTTRIGLDWLALLPELLPFIAELQEDDDEAVERETRRWMKQIEDITGEDMGDMLA